MTVGPVTMIRLPMRRAKEGVISNIRNAVSAEPSQVMSTPMVSKRLITVEVCENSLISKVSPPSNRIRPTASDTTIGKNLPS